MTKPRIAVAGIHIESSTFTPYISTADDFIVTRGEELMERFYWRDEGWATQIEWIPVLHSRALPGLRGVEGRDPRRTRGCRTSRWSLLRHPRRDERPGHGRRRGRPH